MADTWHFRAKKWKSASLRKICASLRFETSFIWGSGIPCFWFWYKVFLVLVQSVLSSGTKCFEFW